MREPCEGVRLFSYPVRRRCLYTRPSSLYRFPVRLRRHVPHGFMR
jgi:hypothetical protein